MEYIDGVTLEEYLQDRGGSLPISEVLCIGLKLCNILHYLHSQQPPIVFCDLKPSNIMLTPDQRLVLVDFGIAGRYLETEVSQQRGYGTLGYAAPEMYPDEQGDCWFRLSVSLRTTDPIPIGLPLLVIARSVFFGLQIPDCVLQHVI